MNPKNNLLIGAIIAVIVVTSYDVGVEPIAFFEGLPNLGIVAKEMTEFESEHWETAFWAMLETIEMAFVGTIIGVAISLPLSIFAARNISSKFVYGPLRALLAATRTFPSILWAILFVIVVGLGPFAGILAITLYTVGFISKLQYESIEAIDYDPVESTKAIGLSKLQLIRYVIIPESAPHLLSQILYMFDYNVSPVSYTHLTLPTTPYV